MWSKFSWNLVCSLICRFSSEIHPGLDASSPTFAHCAAAQRPPTYRWICCAVAWRMSHPSVSASLFAALAAPAIILLCIPYMKLVVSCENLNEQWILCFNVAMSISWVVTCVCAALYLANMPTRTSVQIYNSDSKRLLSQCIGIIECNHVQTAFRIVSFWRLDKWSKCHRCWSSILIRMACVQEKLHSACGLAWMCHHFYSERSRSAFSRTLLASSRIFNREKLN